jgi:C-methyltransferase C-terminal domain/Methyltransferase domain
VVDVDVTDVGLGDVFADAGFDVHGYVRHPGSSGQPRPWIASAAFDAASAAAVAGSSGGAGVVIASHALSHAEQPDRLMAAIASILAPTGVLAIEFHHVLGLAEGQFDVLSHAHRSYLSLHSLTKLLQQNGLAIVDAELVDVFGGTVRAVARPAASVKAASVGRGVSTILEIERAARLAEPAGYAGLPSQMARACADLRTFLERVRDEGTTVAGYGAAARGTVLLNVAEIGPELLPFIVDRSTAKQGRLLPGARIPVRPPAELERVRPQHILILPWPLAGEITDQLAAARAWGARFAVALPHLRVT